MTFIEFDVIVRQHETFVNINPDHVVSVMPDKCTRYVEETRPDGRLIGTNPVVPCAAVHLVNSGTFHVIGCYGREPDDATDIVDLVVRALTEGGEPS